MADYVTQTLLELTMQGAGAIDPDVLDQVATAASRRFDRLAEVPDNFFAAAEAEATDKTFYGNNLSLLPLPPFTGALGAVIFDKDGDDEETLSTTDYVVQGTAPNQYLTLIRSLPAPDSFGRRDNHLDRANYSHFYGWQAQPTFRQFKTYTISARWGFAAIPADITQAVAAIAVKMARETDPAKAAMSNLSEQVSQDLPPMVERTAANYRRQMIQFAGV